MRWGLRQRERDRVEEVLDMIALSERREVLGSHLSHGEKQWLEIGMVISSDPELLLLDEPTAGMTHQESAMTAELIQRLGELHTVLVIDHDMAFVELLDASISVLHMGKLLKEGSMEAIRSDPSVVSVYLGQSLVAAHA
jgi:urea transport system ATP-binding protein